MDQTAPQYERLMIPEEASEFLGVSLKHLNELIEFGKIRIIKISKKYIRFSRGDLELYLGSCNPVESFANYYRYCARKYGLSPDDLEYYKMRAERNDGYIYFIEAGDMVKIGYSTHPNKRFMDLQITSPVPLTLNYLIPGDPGLERHLHKQFAHLRAHGEWFVEKQLIIQSVRKIFKQYILHYDDNIQ